jgi:hypothetical protein
MTATMRGYTITFWPCASCVECCFKHLSSNRWKICCKTWPHTTAVLHGAPCTHVVTVLLSSPQHQLPRVASAAPPLTWLTAAAAPAAAPLAFAVAAASAATVVINRRAAWPYQEAAAAPACLLQLLRPAACCLPTSCSACCHCMQKEYMFRHEASNESSFCNGCAGSCELTAGTLLLLSHR